MLLLLFRICVARFPSVFIRTQGRVPSPSCPFDVGQVVWSFDDRLLVCSFTVIQQPKCSFEGVLALFLRGACRRLLLFFLYMCDLVVHVPHLRSKFRGFAFHFSLHLPVRLIENDVPLCVPIHDVEEFFTFLQAFLEISESHTLVHAVLVLEIGQPVIHVLGRSVHGLEVRLN